MSQFKKLLNVHLLEVHKDLAKIITEINYRSNNHDLDKLFDSRIYDVYNLHFETLKSIEFGTKQYYDYEAKYFKDAHKLHAQNRHHFYSKFNKQKDTNLIDLIEAVVDINASVKQYSSNDVETKSMESIMKKLGDTELTIDELILNTIKWINESENNVRDN